MTETTTDKALVRVAIAKDVLKQLRYWQIETGVYLNTSVPLIPDTDLKTQLETVPSKVCHVCAIGACFLAYVQRFDKVKTNFWGTVFADNMKLALEEYFDLHQLYMIESAFELWPRSGVEFVLYYYNETPSFRLRKIMQNIVANNGEFVVEKYIKAAKKYAEKKGTNTNGN